MLKSVAQSNQWKWSSLQNSVLHENELRFTHTHFSGKITINNDYLASKTIDRKKFSEDNSSIFYFLNF